MGAGGKPSVLFVCLGNICRSPTAEGVFLAKLRVAGLEDAVRVDSAGTGSWHVGERADARARAEAERRGLELPSVSRQVTAEDFDAFDLLLAMDGRNRRDLVALARTDEARNKVKLFRSYDPTAEPGAEVPDPYYGGDEGFAEVFDMCERASDGLLEALREAQLP